MRARGRRGKAGTRHTIDGGVARSATDSRRGTFLDCAGLAADQFRLCDINRRIVQRINRDRQGDFSPHTDLIGRCVLMAMP